MLALVLGGAACVWDDALAALRLARFDLVLAVNDMIPRWPGPLDCAVTLHPDNLPGWLAARRIKGRRDPGEVWAHRLAPSVTRTTSDWRGSSGLLAVKVALVEHAADGVVLAGVPIDRSEHFARPGKPWGDAHAFYGGWCDHKAQIERRTRSLSGWTGKTFGPPKPEWLVEIKAGPPDGGLIELIERREADMNLA